MCATHWSAPPPPPTTHHHPPWPFWLKSIAGLGFPCAGLVHALHIQAVVCKPDAKSVKPLLDCLAHFLAAAVLMLAASKAVMMGHHALGMCLVTMGTFVFPLQASSLSLQDCFVSLVGLFVMILLDGCAALGAPDLGCSLMTFSPVSAFLFVQVAARSVVVSPGMPCCSDGAKDRAEPDGSSEMFMLVAPGYSVFGPGVVRVLACGMGRVSVFLDGGPVVGAVFAGWRD